MRPNQLNVVLAAILLVVMTMVTAIRPDYTRPNWEFLPTMKTSPAVHAFEVQPHFPNGRTLQPAVAGTIARGHLPLHFTATKEDAVRAGEELRNPYQQPIAAAGTPADAVTLQAELAASVSRGEGVYRIYCVACHGASGAGDGPVAQRGFPPPPPLTSGKSAQMKDGQLFHILTYGQGSMSSMAAQLDHNKRWDAVNYVRALQSQAAVATTPSPPSTSPPVQP